MKAPSVHRFSGRLKRYIICKLKETNQCNATDRLVNCFAYHKNITGGIHEIRPDRYWKQSLHIQISLNVSHFFLHCPGVQSFSGYCPATILLYQAYQRCSSSVINSSCVNARVVNLGSFPYRQALQKNPYLWLDHYILICYLRAVKVRCIKNVKRFVPILIRRPWPPSSFHQELCIKVWHLFGKICCYIGTSI